MAGFANAILLVVVVGLIIFFALKKKKKNTLEQEQSRQKELLEEETKQKAIEELEKIWEEKQKEFACSGLPTIEPKTLRLTNNEFCHFEGEASFCKLKQDTVGYEGGSRGVSFRIIKGISFRVGNFQGHNIKETVIKQTNGSIYLTSKKIVFTAITNSRIIKYKDIVNLNTIDDMLQIQTEEGSYLFQICDFLNFLSILNYIINKSE